MKKKKEIEEDLKERHKAKAEELLLNENYKEDIKKYKETSGRLSKVLRSETISDKYSIGKPYSKEELSNIIDKGGLLQKEITKIVRPGNLNRVYLDLTVKIDEPKSVILALIDELLDIYTKGIQKKRYREGKIDTIKEGLKIIDAVSKGKSLLQIAKERCGINKNPAYDESGRVKAEYEKVKRYYKNVRKLKNSPR